MRLLLLCLFAVLSMASCKVNSEAFLFSYFTGNGEDGLHLAYSRNGETWEAIGQNRSFLKPVLGKDRLMRDPFIAQGPDGTFHLIWTTGWWDKHIGHASSKDLIKWSEQKAIPVMEHEPTARNCWAPEMIYHSNEKLWYIFWATTIPGRHESVETSESEKGLNHRMYYTTTKDFRTFSETKLFFNPSFSVIDASILQKEGMFWMFLKNENSNPPEKNIRISTGNHPSGISTEVSAPITGNYWAEGPSPLRVGNAVYVYFDKYTLGKYGAIRSTDMKTWEDVSDRIFFPPHVRHGSTFRVKKRVLNTLIDN